MMMIMMTMIPVTDATLINDADCSRRVRIRAELIALFRRNWNSIRQLSILDRYLPSRRFCRSDDHMASQ